MNERWLVGKIKYYREAGIRLSGAPSLDGGSLTHKSLTTQTAQILPQKQKAKLKVTAYYCCFQRIKKANIKCDCQKSSKKHYVKWENWAVVKSTALNCGVLGSSLPLPTLPLISVRACIVHSLWFVWTTVCLTTHLLVDICLFSEFYYYKQNCGENLCTDFCVNIRFYFSG